MNFVSRLSITYNAFNLPETISSGNTLQAKYTYLSDGTKVSALDASGAGLVYRGPFTYRRISGGTLTFESSPFDRGRLTEAGARYHVTDHLGSVRAVIDGNASTTTYPLTGFYSVDDFAPFGTKSTSSASLYLNLASTGSTVSLRDGFTGQEDQSPDFGVGYSDFGARQYSPTLSRWLVPDPLSEKYYDVSPYEYCAGNPVNLVDSEGKEGVKYIGKNGIKTVESNIVVILQPKKAIPEGASLFTINRINRDNYRIELENNEQIQIIEEQLDLVFNGENGGSYNSSNELVHFVFNVIGIETDNTITDSYVNSLAVEYGLDAVLFGIDVKAQASVITPRPTNGTLGLHKAHEITLRHDASDITIPHEVGHSLGLHHTNESDGLMSDQSTSYLSKNEVDLIWEKAKESR